MREDQKVTNFSRPLQSQHRVFRLAIRAEVIYIRQLCLDPSIKHIFRRTALACVLALLLLFGLLSLARSGFEQTHCVCINDLLHDKI